MRIGTVVIAWCLMSTFVFADSAPVVREGVGGSVVVPIRNRNIQMVREVVEIDCGWTTYTVRAYFWFKNTTSEEQYVQIGFPIDYMSQWEDPEKIQEARETIDVKWNGKPIQFSHAKLQQVQKDFRDQYRQWVYWTVRFGPNQTATNRVSYTYGTWNMDTGSKFDKPYAYLKYILKSGAAWNGPIESAIVRIHYYGISGERHLGGYKGDFGDPYPKLSNISIYPKGYVVDKKNHTVTWDLKNIEPDKDIYFGWGEVPDFSLMDKETPIHFADDPTSITKRRLK